MYARPPVAPAGSALGSAAVAQPATPFGLLLAILECMAARHLQMNPFDTCPSGPGRFFGARSSSWQLAAAPLSRRHRALDILLRVYLLALCLSSWRAALESAIVLPPPNTCFARAPVPHASAHCSPWRATARIKRAAARGVLGVAALSNIENMPAFGKADMSQLWIWWRNEPGSGF